MYDVLKNGVIYEWPPRIGYDTLHMHRNHGWRQTCRVQHDCRRAPFRGCSSFIRQKPETARYRIIGSGSGNDDDDVTVGNRSVYRSRNARRGDKNINTTTWEEVKEGEGGAEAVRMTARRQLQVVVDGRSACSAGPSSALDTDR